MSTEVFDGTTPRTESKSLPDFEVPADKTTVLDSLREALKDKLTLDPIEVTVPLRPSIKLIFDVNLDTDQMSHWRKRATDKALKEVSSIRMAATTIVNQCRGVKLDGVLVTDKDGVALTFRDKQFLDMLGGSLGGSLGAVRWLFGADADILDTLFKIVDAAGFGEDGTEDDDAEDPTQSS